MFERRVVLHPPLDAESGTIIVLHVPAAQRRSAFVDDLRVDRCRESPD